MDRNYVIVTLCKESLLLYVNEHANKIKIRLANSHLKFRSKFISGSMACLRRSWSNWVPCLLSTPLVVELASLLALSSRLSTLVITQQHEYTQTAGLAFGGTGLCSYRVRGVDGSCAEHSTVESYTVFICQQSYLLLFGDQPLTLSLQA